MKNRLKKICSSLLVMGVVLGIATPVSAAESSVIFKGLAEGFAFNPGSQYTDSDLFDGFKGIMPGDRLTETIEVKNDAGDCDYIKLFIKPLVHDEANNPLSPAVSDAGETMATMKDFLAQLRMKVYHNGVLFFEASPEATGGISENVFLGEIRRDESVILNVELEVPIDLENKYANRVGEVDWLFVAEGFDDPEPPPGEKAILTVHKVWVDGNNPQRPDEVTAVLLKDGVEHERITLTKDTQWTHTWDKLDPKSQWTVKEADVPEGYGATYSVTGNQVLIINTMDNPPVIADPPEPVDLSVRKVWSGDENQLAKRPESVGITLYDGTTPVETIWLGDWNQWTHRWTDLNGKGSWSVLEVDIPMGYTPSYKTKGDGVTITNTATLIYTGQLNWPIMAMGGLGVLIVAFGLLMVFQRERDNHA